MMSIFSRFRNRDRPKNSLAGDSYRPYVGRTTSGNSVTQRSSMQLTAVYACVRVLAEGVASLPLITYREQGNGKKTRATDHPLYYLLHDEPNPEMTSFSFRETLMTHLLLYGNAYAQIIRNGKGEVIALYPLMPDRMKVDRDDHGNIYYEYMKQQDEAATMKTGTVILKPENILHIPGLGFDGLVGYSPIAMAKNAIGMASACEEYGASFFANGANPGAVLEHPGVLKDPEKVRTAWQEAYGGPNKGNRVAVLEEGMKFTPISINPQEAQFLETRKFQIEEIARIFRVPVHLIGDLEHATYSNIEEQSLEFVQYTLQPWLIRWEQAMQRSLFRQDEKKQYFIRFNVDGLLRGDYASRMQGYATGINNGFMCVNDIRQLENMDLIPEEEGGNIFMVNGTMTPLKDVGAAYKTQENEEPEKGSEEDNPDEQGEEKDNEEVLEMGNKPDQGSGGRRDGRACPVS
jgi:HK97 family phage portal protein